MRMPAFYTLKEFLHVKKINKEQQVCYNTEYCLGGMEMVDVMNFFLHMSSVHGFKG